MRKVTLYDSGTQPEHFEVATHSRTVFHSRVTRLDWSWPTVLSLAALVMFIFGVSGGRDAVSSGLQRAENVVRPTDSGAGRPRQVLLLTSNSEIQKNAILTLSPRGLTPVLPRSLNELKQMISSHGSQIRLIVLDESFPHAAVITQLLRKNLPATRVVFLKSSSRPQDVGPMLLNSL
jgi:hypothetical protein